MLNKKMHLIIESVDKNYIFFNFIYLYIIDETV